MAKRDDGHAERCGHGGHVPGQRGDLGDRSVGGESDAGLAAIAPGGKYPTRRVHQLRCGRRQLGAPLLACVQLTVMLAEGEASDGSALYGNHLGAQSAQHQ
jgi:hypothetical protein